MASDQLREVPEQSDATDSGPTNQAADDLNLSNHHSDNDGSSALAVCSGGYQPPEQRFRTLPSASGTNCGADRREPETAQG